MRYDYTELVGFGQGSLTQAGLSSDRAKRVAEILVEGDLFGHDTHGLALLAPYVAAIEAGTMNAEGSWAVISDNGQCASWDGRKLPGPWLVTEGINAGVERAKARGSYALAIQNSHHIACLAAYLKAVTDKGLFILLASSDPANASVAPFGSTKRLYSPNPVAAGIPTIGDPILLDISMSITTHGFASRSFKEKKLLPHPWVLDSGGQTSADPAAYVEDAGGSLLPLGGLESGHKGFALGLLVEALTSALAGGGRADGATGWGSSVFVLILDPEKFGGLERFARETTYLADRVRSSPAIGKNDPVRLPGERGLKLRRDQLAHGVNLSTAIEDDLRELARKFGLKTPKELDVASRGLCSFPRAR